MSEQESTPTGETAPVTPSVANPPSEKIATDVSWLKTHNGSFSLTDMDEEIYRQIHFNKPLVVEWYYVKEKSFDGYVAVEVNLDGGIHWMIYLALGGSGHPCNALAAQSEEELVKSVKTAVNYEFMHAFFHWKDDPNYDHLHWALYGLYRHLTTYVELDCEEDGTVIPAAATALDTKPEDVQWKKPSEEMPVIGSFINILSNKDGWELRTVIYNTPELKFDYWHPNAGIYFGVPLPAEVTGKLAIPYS